jgi:hypothetical protein
VPGTTSASQAATITIDSGYEFEGYIPGSNQSAIKCTSAKSKGTTCTATYVYGATAALAARAPAEAVAEVNGRSGVVGTGTIRDRRLRLTFRHLRAGRYRLTLLELPADGKPVVVGHSALRVG